MAIAPSRLDHLSFKGNLKHTRYGWLRLTPAYSVHLVSEVLNTIQTQDALVLDPFCGTGTTALACAERGIACDTLDINPFLVWLTRTKAQVYSTSEIEVFERAARDVAEAILSRHHLPTWTPPLHQIEKWWDDGSLAALGRAMHTIQEQAQQLSVVVLDLLKMAFCRTLIERANVSFGHQSMSFKQPGDAAPSLQLFSQEQVVAETWCYSVADIAKAARSPIVRQPRVFLCDARNISTSLESNRYTHVITSPPYPNRVSYIRELRPYMYWLGYLDNKRAAGELDWQAIGGTWGIATSNVAKWKPPTAVGIPFDGFTEMVSDIGKQSDVLARYVHKYFYDLLHHCQELFRVVRSSGTITYIVGNSKFYDVVVPVEAIYADIFRYVGFEQVGIRTIRKRSSKRELLEFAVSARKP